MLANKLKKSRAQTFVFINIINYFVTDPTFYTFINFNERENFDPQWLKQQLFSTFKPKSMSAITWHPPHHWPSKWTLKKHLVLKCARPRYIKTNVGKNIWRMCANTSLKNVEIMLGKKVLKPARINPFAHLRYKTWRTKRCNFFAWAPCSDINGGLVGTFK